MAEPTGTVVGTVTMAGPGLWWRATRYAVGDRVRFHEVEYRRHGTTTIVTVDRVTDDMWDQGDADRWIRSAVLARVRLGLTIQPDQTNGNVGPVGPEERA
jgi:hypothetical protein